jgi:hypothetical protein
MAVVAVIVVIMPMIVAIVIVPIMTVIVAVMTMIIAIATMVVVSVVASEAGGGEPLFEALDLEALRHRQTPDKKKPP